MSDLSHPHDRFFSAVFSNLHTVEDLIMNHIPFVGAWIVPGSLEDCQEKLMNPELEKFYADILMKAKLRNGQDALIYLLLEHKSYQELKVAFHLLRYMIRI